MKRFTKGFYGFLSIWVLFLAILSGCGGGGGNSPAPASDTTAPTNTTAANFINSGATSTSSTSVTLSISATDSVGVTGYYASETSTTPSASATGWTSVTSTTSYSANVSLTLSSGDATKTVYVWFKDAAGNVSASASDSISLAATLSSKLVGTWGETTLDHNNDGTWNTEVCKFTYNSDNTGEASCQWNNGGTLETGAPDTFTYTVESNSDGSLTTTKTFASDGSTKTHRWVIGDDGNVMILDGTTNTDKQRLRVAVRLDTAKTYTNADLIGDYFLERYRYNGSYTALAALSTFDGVGGRNYTLTSNVDGGISTDAGPIVGTYNVSSDGLYTIDNANTGYLLGDGKFGINTHVNDPATWSFGLTMRKGDKTYSTADLAGTWAIASFWDDMGGPSGGTPFGATFGTMTCTGSGSCSFSYKNQKSGVVTYASSTRTFSVASDGSFGASLATGAPSYSAAIGNNGDTVIFNSSFDATYPSVRGIYIAVKCSACGDLAATSAPSAPTGVTTTASDGQVAISWSAVSGATSYNIYWSTTTGVTKTNGTKISNATSPYTHASLTNGTTYYYVVTAVNSSGESVESAQASATPSLFSGTYTGSWSKTCPTCGITASAGTFTTTLNNGVFSDTQFILTSGDSGIRFDSGTVSSTGAITGTGATPSQCSSSVSTFTGQITATASGGAEMTITYSRTASPEGCAAEFGTVTATRTTTTTASETWTTKASMPTARQMPGATGLNGLLYVVGGYSGTSSLGTLEVYDPVTDTWATKASMSAARHAAAVGVINGLLYVAGGYNAGGLTILEAYDPSTDTWTTKASMPINLQGSGVVVNGILYVAGGASDGFCSSVVEAYDPATDTWSTKASKPTATCWHGVAADNNGLIYAIGGGNTSSTILYTNVEVYNPTTNTWTTKASMPTARLRLDASVVNGVIYAVGGSDLLGNVFSTVEAYDPVTDTWSTKASMPTARNVLSSGVVNGILYAVGGVNGSGVTLSNNEAYTP